MQMQVPKYDENMFFEKRSSYCLLIPIFNEGARYKNQVKKMQQNGIFDMIDVIICDAGSTDGSTEPEFLRETGHRGLLTRKGSGRQSTDVRMGYAWALEQGYEGFITVDGNDKDDTSALPKLIEKLDEGYDYVQGSRYARGGKAINTPLVRYIAHRFISEPIIAFCAGKRITDTTNGFRAYSKKYMTDERVQPFRDIFYGYEYIYYLPARACKLGFRFCEIPVVRSYPASGEVPTKVGGIKGDLYLISILYHLALGHYNPESRYKFKKKI